MHPFWSPDGRYVGFFSGNKLMKIPAAGGPAVSLADAPNPRGGYLGHERHDRIRGRIFDAG